MLKTLLFPVLISGFFLINTTDTVCQISNYKIDSLVKLTKSPVDSIRLNALKALTWESRFSDPIKGFEYGFDGMALADKLGNGHDLAVLHNYVGVLAIKINSLDKAKIQVQIAYHIADSLDITTEKAYALNNLGEIHSLSGNHDSAFSLLIQAVELFRSENDLTGLAYTYNQMGLTLREQKKYDGAISYHLQVLKIREKLKDKPFITRALQNLGIDYLEKGEYSEARKYFNKIDSSQLEKRTRFSFPYVLILTGKTYQSEKNFSTAIKYYKMGLEKADSLGLYSEMADASKLLSDIYNRLKEYKKALFYFNIYKINNDSVKSHDLAAEYQQIELKREFEQKYRFLEYKMQQDIDNQKLKLYWNRILLYSFLGFLVVLLIMIISLIRKSRMIANQNKLLITQKQEIEQKNISIVQQRDELALVNATKDKFFSILAHDLRGPVGNFLSFTNMVIEKHHSEINEKLMSLLLIVNSSAQQTLALLENLLTWARSQTGVIAYKPLLQNLSGLINNNINLIQNKADEKGISLQNLIKEEIICNVDHLMIDTVIRNLLSNALKFTPQNGKIEISSIKQEHSVDFKISDSGIGMNQAEIDQLFRLDVKHKSKEGTQGEKGTGLGLILCKEFIEKHGGKIRVESEPGKGSTFIVTLPAQ